jgi:hypothetical protein
MLQYIENSSQSRESKNKQGVAYDWHIDHVTIMAQMIYLSDIHSNGTCMEIVTGSHRLPNSVFGLYSDDYIQNSGFSIKKLFGP